MDVKFAYTSDTQCNSSYSKQATEHLTAKRVQAILVDICAGSAIPGLPVAEQSQTVILSASVTFSHSMVFQGSPYFFRTTPSDAYIGQGIASVAATANSSSLLIICSKPKSVYDGTCLSLAQSTKSAFTSLNPTSNVTIADFVPPSTGEHDNITLSTYITHTIYLHHTTSTCRALHHCGRLFSMH